jgi:1-acyl-sn-glycerol-3-phosphate acyltransferase
MGLNFKEIFAKLEDRYVENVDPWGLDLNACRRASRFLYPIYKNYFSTRVFGAENVEDKPYLVVSNHSGQIPIDALLVSIAFVVEVDPPRILRGMADRFVSEMPFFSEQVSKLGAVLGDRKNCSYLLKRGESPLVFPEGVRGISKSTKNFYHLQSFTRGFFRLALEHKVDVLPVAVVGAEEAYPLVMQLPGLAKTLGLPAIPITPTFPLLGPLGFTPLPTSVDIYIGKPYAIGTDLSEDAPDEKIDPHVNGLREQIQKMVNEGLNKKRSLTGELMRKAIEFRSYSTKMYAEYMSQRAEAKDD